MLLIKATYDDDEKQAIYHTEVNNINHVAIVDCRNKPSVMEKYIFLNGVKSVLLSPNKLYFSGNNHCNC